MLEKEIELMEKNKNNKGLIWLVSILIVFVLGLIGFVIYDKFLKVDKTIPSYSDNTTLTTTNLNTTTNKNQQNEPVEKRIELKDLDFPINNDLNVILYGNIFNFFTEDIMESGEIIKDDWGSRTFKNVNFMYNNLNFNINCISYDEYITNFCINEKIIVNNKVEINFEIDTSTSEKAFFLITDKYVIVQKSDGMINTGAIEIYDYNGTLLKKIDNTTNYLIARDGCKVIFESNISYNMRLIDNKLHYIEVNNGAVYKTLDLNTYEEKIIDFVKADVSQQC